MNLFLINNVVVKDGKVNLILAALGGKEIKAPLPNIHLKDIGKEKGGATPAEAFEKIFSSLYKSISSDSVTKVFNDGLKKLGNLKDLKVPDVKAGGAAAQKTVDSAKQGAKSATEGLKGLFKKE